MSLEGEFAVISEVFLDARLSASSGDAHGLVTAAQGLSASILLLVEEQRTANLLAMATATHANGSAMFPGEVERLRAELVQRLDLSVERSTERRVSMADYWDSELGEALHALVESSEGSRQEREAIDKIADFIASEHSCQQIIYHGSRNPDSANFGPDEYCEELAAPGSEYCPNHQGPDL